MKRSARSLFVFGIYLMVLGLVVFAFPDPLMRLLGFAPTKESWVRVAGILVAYLGCYDTLSAHAEFTPYIRWSVPIRLSAIFFFGALVLLRLAQPVLLVFPAIDVISALWTAIELRRERDA